MEPASRQLQCGPLGLVERLGDAVVVVAHDTDKGFARDVTLRSVARSGNRLGPWAVPDVVYGAIVCAAGLASIASPLVLQPLLHKWSQVSTDGSEGGEDV